MRNKCYLPSSLEELKGMSEKEMQFYWRIFYLTEPRNKKAMIRPLWYAIQCERTCNKLDEKYITRLNRYANNPEKYIERANKSKYSIAAGTEITKVYKGREYKVLVKSTDEYEYEGKEYRTLSAIACEISGTHVSGPDFFGLR